MTLPFDGDRGVLAAMPVFGIEYQPSGWFKVRPDGIEINPGPDAYDQEGAVIKIEGGKVTEIISLADHADRTQYLLEPELITNISDRKEREKRRYVHYDDIPKVMEDAVLSAEDKHFYSHPGVDPIGILRAAFVDLKDRRASRRVRRRSPCRSRARCG